MTDAELGKLEQELRALFPVALALAARERWSREVLVNKLVKLAMTCVKTSSGKL